MSNGDADGTGDVERVSTKIAREVAAREGVDPTSLTPRLGEVVDPDAIDALFTTDGVDGTLEFTYCGYGVVVQSDDEVTVETERRTTAGKGRTSAGARSDVD